MLNKLPQSQLIQVLIEKADARSDVEFNYLAELDNLRKRVSGDVRFINQLFPEYTPHDEEYHLSRLFHVADTLLGQDRYENMNATELFVLACGLYGHDWGMAVSDAERRYIVSGVLPDGFQPTDFALLNDETRRFERFLSERRLEIKEIKRDGIADEEWREYVRQTHAYRSGERVRHYFRNVDSGVAEAGGRVCEGHWLNIEDIQDFKRYPTNFAVLRESLNLAAIAVYVRLVDLLDIGHDRTPYVIWKFVAPRDRRSHMEWEKHRALQAVTCPGYLNGRVVLVDGSTDDHEVYAALEDLRIYCATQVRECMDLLAHLSDHKHQLDFYHVQWRVAARGFDPVTIRFEFDRSRVFDILSGEIYQDDPYVFLRELLQNSIDAIRARREILRQNGIGTMETFGLIRVEVEHGTNGDATIIWTDDGIGMDEYIVRNYLSVAGKSFYRSEEFERMGLSMDPISRFGVGILSCFIVADRVEIETKKDPYATSSGQALRIQIPSVTRQFRTEKLSPRDIGIGTRVKVYVEGHRLPEKIKKLDVTKYLKVVAGFVEFPILISEDDRLTLILHPPSQVDPEIDQRFRAFNNIETHQVALRFPMDEAVVPQDLETAKSMFVERSIDLQADLGLTDFEGRITYLELLDKSMLLQRNTSSGVGSGLEISDPRQDKKVPVRWNGDWMHGFRWPQPNDMPKSAVPQLTYSIYKDGILVPGAIVQEEHYSHFLGQREYYARPRKVINILQSSALKLDISRTGTRADDKHWYSPVKQGLTRKCAKDLLEEIRSLTGLNKFHRYGLFLATYHLGEEFLRNLLLGELPVCVLTSEGNLAVKTWREFEGQHVMVFPEQLTNEVNLLIHHASRLVEYKSVLSAWSGSDSLLCDTSYAPLLTVETAIGATKFLLYEYYDFNGVNLLESPHNDLPPLVQEIWVPKKSSANRTVHSLATQAVKDPLALSEQERHKLLLEAFPYSNIKFAIVPGEEHTPFIANRQIYNIAHPVGTLLFRSIAWLHLSKLNKSKADALTGKLTEFVYGMLETYSNPSASRFDALSASLFNSAVSLGLADRSEQLPTIGEKDLWYISRHFIVRGDYKTSFGYPIHHEKP
jgi:hypothetical protein